MSLGKVHHLHFGVDDLEKTVKYFTEKLGFKLESSAKPPDRFSIELVSPAGDLIFDFNQITEANRKRGESGMPFRRPFLHHVAFEVGDLDKTYEELKSKGVPFKVPPAFVEKYGRQVANTCDADGRKWIQLQVRG